MSPILSFRDIMAPKYVSGKLSVRKKKKLNSEISGRCDPETKHSLSPISGLCP